MTHALALDTTSDFLSLAVLRAGEPAGSHYALCGTGIARTILHETDALLRGAGVAPEALDVLFVGCGPGSFTGTRIGMSVALTLGRVLGRPVLGVDALSILAAQTDPGLAGTFHVLLNCVRDEVYHAPFRWRGSEVEALAPIRLITAASAAAEIGRAPCLVRRFETVHSVSPVQPGPEAHAGWETLLAGLTPAPLRHAQPDALRLLAVGLPRYLARPGGPFEPPAPVYLKSEAFRTWRPAREAQP
jgi:tRNA threonylcarbamoyl adenosine modification protein YeaZ